MKVFRGTLTFVLGMVMGVVLFFVSIFGTLAIVASTIRLGSLEEQIGIDIFDDDSEIVDKTLLDFGLDAYNDFRALLSRDAGLSDLSINELASKFGVKNKLGSILSERLPVDVSPLLESKLSDMGEGVQKVIDSITLNDVGRVAGLDFSQYTIPIIQNNLNTSILKVVDELLKSINSDMTLRQIEDNFGIGLGENQIFTAVKDAPFSSFGELLNCLEIGTLIDANLDKYVINGETDVYVKTNRYEKVEVVDINKVKEGATTYIASANDGVAIRKELRYVVKQVLDENGEYVNVTDAGGNLVYAVDNSCYKSGDDKQEPVEYYRHYEYEKYDASKHAEYTEFFVPCFANIFEERDGAYVLTENGYFPLDKLYTDGGEHFTINATIDLRGAKTMTDGVLEACPKYGIDVELFVPQKDSSLILGGKEDYLKVAIGTSDQAIQAISKITVSGLNNATDSLLNMNLGSLIEITEDSAVILQTMKDKPLNQLNDNINDLRLSQVLKITFNNYVRDDNGKYVRVALNTDEYVEYNPEIHVDETLYVEDFVPSAEGKYVKKNGSYYLYDANNPALNSLDRFDKNYRVAEAGDVAKPKFVSEGGYYTLYNPELHSELSRYSIVHDGKAVSSKVLQRFGSFTVGEFGAAFNSLLLCEVLDVDVDVYKKVTTGNHHSWELDTDYFYYDTTDNVYKLANVFSAEFWTGNETTNIYVIEKEGSSIPLLKRLAYVKLDQLSSSISKIVDDMRLKEIVDVTCDLFVKDPEGKFVYVTDGNYYAPFNPATHADGTRYSKITADTPTNSSYILQNNPTETDGLFVYDASIKQMVAATGEVDATVRYYALGTASSAKLQRFANVRIGNFSNSFDNLILADIIDVDTDEYERYEGVPDVTMGTYFYYDDGLYCEADATYVGSHVSAQYFTLNKVGKSHVIIRKMAFIKINDLGDRLGDVLDDLYFAELIDVYTNDEVKAVAAEEDGYLIEYNPDYTVYDGSKEYRYAFVLDSDGKYYLKDHTFAHIEIEGTTVSYNYHAIDTTQLGNPLTAAAYVASLGKYFYYKTPTDTTYTLNPTLGLYVISKFVSYPTEPRWQTAINNVYYRELSASGTHNGKAYTQFTDGDGDPMLYVNFMGEYVAYDATEPAHADLDLYMRLTDGYNLPRYGQVGEYYYDIDSQAYTQTPSANFVDVPLVRMQQVSGGYYYFTRLDREYNNHPNKANISVFSKQLCSDVFEHVGEYAVDADLTDKYVLFGAQYVEATTLQPQQLEGLVLLNKHCAYVATPSENSNASYTMSSFKVEIIKEKSAPALRAFGVHNVKIGGLNDALTGFTINDLLDVEPDSILDDPSIRDANVDNLTIAFQNKMKSMSIHDIVNWSNITTLDPKIASAVGDATIEEFFAALTYNQTTGEIYVDILKLYS